ncbi:TIGR03086 family protein [Saccharopolyspora karakumensis]|uniref:TIGR03086 family protein n=1 Tax=Saccharopolyspora karakumensis TaxID=2530386 RepID=A0A4R5BW32_9PSEU|nr:TIGR03086 family metal-binding protein [Saccharopolyspora karakumensis]TDD90349.1 TIGR03086 family protein [Saccharopolyspora karakumensis]
MSDVSARIDVMTAEALEFFVEAVERVPAERWDEPSNLDEWSVRELIGHATGTATKIAVLLEDGEIWETPSEPADWVCDDPAAKLRDIRERVRRALPNADMEASRTSPVGEMPLRQALAFPVADVAMHGWDLHRSCGRSVELPAELGAFCQALIDSVPEQAMRRPGAFAPAKTAPERATSTERLMAFLGRSVD